TAVRPGSWCRTCTCGSRPSGSVGSACCWTMNRGSGRAPVTTTTGTRGASSGTRATDRPYAVAGGAAGRVTGGDAVGADARAARRRLAGPPAGAARGRAADRRGRVPDPAELLDRVGARRRAGGTDRAAGTRRGGVGVPHRGLPAGRAGGGEGTRRRLVRVASRRAGPGVARGRRVGSGAAHGHDQDPRTCRRA